MTYYIYTVYTWTCETNRIIYDFRIKYLKTTILFFSTALHIIPLNGAYISGWLRLYRQVVPSDGAEIVT
jgi:hypothetical protein